jgi:trans-aconitate methyltransferase
VKHCFSTVGFDFSEPMLEIARSRLADEPPQVGERLIFCHADMRAFDLGEAFPLAIIPNASVFHLRSHDELLQCFTCLYAHVKPGALAVVDVVAPRLMADQPVGEENLVAEGANPATGLMTREFSLKLAIDTAKQTIRVQHTYVEQEGGKESRYVFRQHYRWLEPDEGVDLLRCVGFTDIEAVGDYERSPFSSESPRLILMARR